VSTVGGHRSLPTIPDIDRPLRLLVLCTGNICRSPMAEGLLRAKLRARGVPAVVVSAGLSFDDRPATDDAVDAAAAFGVDITAHRSQIVSPGLLQGADLVIAMERLHAREAFVLERACIERCFTLKELVRRGEAAGARRPDEPLERWLQRAGGGRRPMELIGSSDDDDIADPYRRGRAVYDETIAQIDALLDRLVDLAFPAASGREGVAS